MHKIQALVALAKCSQISVSTVGLESKLLSAVVDVIPSKNTACPICPDNITFELKNSGERLYVGGKEFGIRIDILIHGPEPTPEEGQMYATQILSRIGPIFHERIPHTFLCINFMQSYHVVSKPNPL